MAMAPTVDPFAVEDPSELEDWHVPVSFMKSRHSERIRAEPPPEEAWRMKDRVSGLTPRSLAPPLYSFCTVKAWGVEPGNEATFRGRGVFSRRYRKSENFHS